MDGLTTVIFPVAGLGTRMLPATKATPKELLPVYDTPLLQFALDEAIAAGAKRVVLVSHPDKSAIEDYLTSAPALEESLTRKGKADLLRALRATCLPDGVDLRVVHQPEPLGLGHAVLCGAEAVLPGPVGVILPDDLILGDPCLAEMAAAFRPGEMRSLTAAQEVPAGQVDRYGIFACPPGAPGEAIPCTAFVEKPAIADAPSRLAAVGRYILDAAVFDVLRDTGKGAGGEIQLTDAIARMGGIHAFRFSGTRYDCGGKDGLVEATLAVQALRRGAAGRPRIAAE
ncbi:UTP--glucose-1-phosphate uridylyltransferase [Jannaschia formosa]|uniref:UTP--glucose-1-phosphate uridylyltransferase n=1 Tax=Jannaschia formosa TaxID=2259592 RepID=UPI000E1BD0BC|nr:sugar phosphate nucleotidyltransferase [Jannaschia formosa]TFL18818.1 UTP--glucose-1-phosphate uridylyltransferase [Jannaschia formosa]